MDHIWPTGPKFDKSDKTRTKAVFSKNLTLVSCETVGRLRYVFYLLATINVPLPKDRLCVFPSAATKLFKLAHVLVFDMFYLIANVESAGFCSST